MNFAGLDPRFVLTGVTVTDRQLEVGAFAVVLEVEYNRQKYAGKKIHSVLLLEDDPDRLRIVNRFKKECRLFSQFHHPNIVQFVGIFFQ